MDSIISRQRISPRRRVAPKATSDIGIRKASPARRTKGVSVFRVFDKIRGPKRARPVRPEVLEESEPRNLKNRPFRLGKLVVPGVLALGAFCLAIGALSAFSLRPRLPSEVSLYEEASAEGVLSRFVSPTLHDDAEGNEESGLPPLPVTLSVSTYVVRPGDALLSIANRYHISLDTLISMNGISDARRIYAGARLRVPNISGIVHTVAKGDSVGSLASRYGVSSTAILDANDLGSSTIRPGQVLFIPGAHMSPTELKRALGELVAWPIRGPISSYFGYRPDPFTGIRRFHGALDIVARQGTPIKAAMDGRVADVGYNSIYGNYVILTHADSYQTLYGHLYQVSVKKGARVSQNSVIGSVGSTGYSTGPHLHFAVFRRGSAIDPLKLLK